MSQAKLTLNHYWRSSSSWRVRWALNYKGLDYQRVPVNLLEGEQRQAPYKAKNPTNFVPCLEIDGIPYGESMAILEWLEESYPVPALLPDTPRSRLVVRS